MVLYTKKLLLVFSLIIWPLNTSRDQDKQNCHIAYEPATLSLSLNSWLSHHLSLPPDHRYKYVFTDFCFRYILLYEVAVVMCAQCYICDLCCVWNGSDSTLLACY